MYSISENDRTKHEKLGHLKEFKWSLDRLDLVMKDYTEALDEKVNFLVKEESTLKLDKEIVDYLERLYEKNLHLVDEIMQLNEIIKIQEITATIQDEKEIGKHKKEIEKLVKKIMVEQKENIGVNVIMRVQEKEQKNGEELLKEHYFVDSSCTGHSCSGKFETRELEAWTHDCEPADASILEVLDDGHQKGWDSSEMFLTNQQKFGLYSSYSPDMHGYTTTLNVDENSEAYRTAERLAKEIEEKEWTIPNYWEAEEVD